MIKKTHSFKSQLKALANELQLTFLESGIYFIEIKDNSSLIQRTKIIKK
jgi:hypothetical protein